MKRSPPGWLALGLGVRREKMGGFLSSSAFRLGVFPSSSLSGQMSWYVRPGVLVFVLIFNWLACNFRSCGCLGTGIVRMKR